MNYIYNRKQDGITAFNDSGCSNSSGSSDLQDSSLAPDQSALEQGNSSQECNDNEQSEGTSNDTETGTAITCKRNEDKLRYISKYLVQYVPDACPQLRRLQ